MEHLIEGKDAQSPAEDSIEVLNFDVEHGASESGSRRLSVDKRAKRALLQVFLVVVFTPLFCAGIGAGVDRIIYGTSTDNVHFHTRYMAYSALLISPLVLFRFLVGSCSQPAQRKRNINVADFIAYMLLTVAIGVALPRTILAGPEIFHASGHVKDVFTVNGLYEKIQTESDVYDWLTQMAKNVYQDSFPSLKGSRYIDDRGRATLAGSLRLRQSRVKAEPCTMRFKSLGTVGREHCYPPFSEATEDKTTYSPMNFTYYNEPYKLFEGRDLYPNYTAATTDSGSFTLAGFWTFFPSDATSNDTVNQIRDMKNAGWIDAQTRLIGIDATILLPDFHPHSAWGAMQMNIIVTASGKFLPQPFDFIPNYIPATLEGSASDAESSNMQMNNTSTSDGELVGFALLTQVIYQQGKMLRRLAQKQGTPDIYLSEQCSIIVGALFLVPFYLGVFCTLIYTIQVHIYSAIQERSQYFRRFFTYTEILWMIMVFLSWIFWILAAYVQACTPGFFVQPPFPSATDDLASIRTGIAVRLEVSSLGYYWAQARNVLGFSLFLHLFNFLKFLVKFKSLGALIRTLSLAAPELLSFSVSFSVIFIAFVTMFYFLFSVDAVEFQSYERSTLSLWLGMLGELEVTSTLWKNRSWAIPMIILFTFISVFVLLTLIIAIVSNAHERSKVQEESESILREQRIFDAFYSVINKHVRQPTRVHRIHPMKGQAADTTDSAFKLRPFRGAMQRWLARARQRRAWRSSAVQESSVPEGQLERTAVPKDDAVTTSKPTDRDESESNA